MADKVRYYLEQSVPELEDLQDKGLFERNEITMIMRRRTDFEQRIQGRGSRPRDFLKYCDFEVNLEKLRKKRLIRLKSVGLIKQKRSISDWAGPRRILFIMQRSVRRFPGDLELWAKYLQQAKEHGAIKVIYSVYSRLLQLQPRNIDAWLSAARYEFEDNSNAKGARVLFQRGLRLNPDSYELWLNYAQFELTYVSKLLARRQVLGLVTEKEQTEDLQKDERRREAELNKNSKVLDNDEDFNKDVISLPTVSADEVNDQLNHLPEADMNMLGNAETNPVLRGDIALTIYDLCIPAILKTIPKNSTISTPEDKVFEISQAFLSIFDQFDNLNRDYLYLHVLTYLQNNHSNDIRTPLIDINLSTRTLKISDENFAEVLQLSVNKFIAYKMKLKNNKDKDELTNKYTSYLNEKFLTPSIESNQSKRVTTLLKAIIKKCRSI
ncbi:hypothetical protein HYPBUDRAFT_111439 [Hyphopichia burtonii NRRL Y-1933]|uniref:U3 small nucleolar RNA-associated protein 6 N-terminal domain-containing protein n=1 Tax=Hyphopichia burtonii NRRL Y-1933 TaxID=984485 RepID=A0A1E4RGY1_9ASCO|nr:hypothetical protein HYPBUDRAFT_111439 [Hyphopichia burtonii NRRL Y-1933]ODV66527.1 hypothetical protein HYPBUDRAFT_111439 [Hyphopichia burtonii NRRL Y-1933]